MKYPDVLDEFATMQAVVNGASIARYGDGEFKMSNSVVGIKSQHAHPALSRRLKAILHEPGACLVGIPNINAVMSREDAWPEKQEFWGKHARFEHLLDPKRSYVSSFISRPDSAPWINTEAYWTLVQSLWIDQDVTVVGGSGKSLKPEDLEGAREITHVPCRRQHAWQDYDEILDRIGTPRRALLCLGPTATVLAVDLCARGVHAIDLGHIAMFWRKRHRGEPMVVTEDDKAADQVVPA